MASMHLGSFSQSFSVPAVGSYARTKSYYAGCYIKKASWYKAQKIHHEYSIVRQQQHNLKHHCRCIEGGSSCQECVRSFVVNAAPVESFESQSQIPTPKSFWDSAKTLYKFSRPYATIPTAMNIISVSLLAVEKWSDISPTFFIGLLKAMAVFFPMRIYYVAVNDFADFEIDKINKPYLPMASGEYSFGTVAVITASSLILSYVLGWSVGSPPLIWVISSHFIFGTAYSANLSMMRWKRSSMLTAMNYVVDRAIVFPLGLFLHMQDIPDIEGDEKFGIQTLAVRLGQKQVFWICVLLFEMGYGAAILFVATTSSCLRSKLITGLGHVLLASILWYHAKSVDVKNKANTQSFYMLIWKLYCVECFILPLVK